MTQWDDIIVGRGLLGACVARRLAEAGRRVLIVECGRSVSRPTAAHVRNELPLRDDADGLFAGIDQYFDYLDPGAPDASLPGAFTTSIDGGLGVVWTNNCPRAFEGVDRPSFLSTGEWDSNYAVAETMLEVSDDQFLDSSRQRAVVDQLRSPLSEAGRGLEPLPLSGHRMGPQRIHYIGPADVLAASHATVEVAVGTVDRVDVDGRRAVLRIGDETHDASHVVIAAGAIGTPQLLWRSGIRPPSLGSHLSYHPVLMGQVVIDAAIDSSPNRPDPLPRLGITPTVDQPWFVMLLRDTNPFTPTGRDRDVAPDQLIEIQAFAPVDPEPGNRMRFGDNTVNFEVPLREPDEARRRAIANDVNELCAAIGRWRAGCEPQWAALGTPHLMGSCRMGYEQATSVANPLGQVHGTEQLYLATTGLIPTRLAVNPTLTAAALAVRTADHLIGS